MAFETAVPGLHFGLLLKHKPNHQTLPDSISDELPDEELADQSAKGSDGHLAILINRYSSALYRLAYRITGNAQDAEETVQDTFVKVYRALPQSRRDLPFKPWLYRIAINTALTTLRKKKKFVLMETLEEVAGHGPDQAGHVDGNLNMQEALNKLPLKFRQAVVLRAVEDLSYKEIGQILEVEEATARSWFFRAKKILEKHITL